MIEIRKNLNFLTWHPLGDLPWNDPINLLLSLLLLLCLFSTHSLLYFLFCFKGYLPYFGLAIQQLFFHLNLFHKISLTYRILQKFVSSWRQTWVGESSSLMLRFSWRSGGTASRSVGSVGDQREKSLEHLQYLASN